MRIQIHPWTEAPAPVERPIFAIGDVHGTFGRLVALHDAISSIIADDRLVDPQVIHLGDYIDRGPQSMASLAAALDGIFPDDVALPGNHEQFLHMALFGDPNRILWLWFMNGGRTVAAELGFSPKSAMADPAPFIDAVRERLGEVRLERFRTLPNHVRHGRYLFVHGGIHPGLPLETMLDQPWTEVPQAEDLDPLWIRGPFLTHDGAFPEDAIVVHGHTIMPEPQLRTNRLSLDTGAYRGGALSALELRGAAMRLIQVHA